LDSSDPLLGLPPAAPPASAPRSAPPASGSYTRPPFPQPPPPTPARTDATASVPYVSSPSVAGFGAGAPGVDEFLAAVGLDPAQVNPAVYEQMGAILRIVVQGLVDVLQSRAEIKNNFRMPMTSLRPVENNPLKFSMNTDDALHNLFVKRNPGYLGPIESFQEAFQDVSFHQMAMLAGIRAAYDAMLAKLHPDHLEELFDRKLKRTALLSVGRQSKFWDLYREQFEDIESDVEAHFQRLFGEEFAKAYNEQLQRLNATARAQRR
jgi:type VI secretion system FHA domain protein